ncbi:hypothetical protein [Tropicimonas sediminicola]|uniref:2-keto-4-pentenoate hydratase n=1 Tax=Tropicimonas sediminicola TaxID=1031541 RepID=A0A239K351_9RHOB|nr:hypothetical protein [Tropicimonas sediminicola]SNT12525.1 2-keto-4-pentenoate hydratase [Tropicimonas sediminicola]
MNDVDKLIEDLVAAHRTGARISPAAASLSREEILRVQGGVADALGAVAGFKVAPVPGSEPILAPIPACYVVGNGGQKPVTERFGVELEIGFELMRPLPEGGAPERLEDYFRPCAMFELVDTRLAGEAAEDAAYKFADLQINAGYVQGDVLEGWDGSDFGVVTARLKAGEEMPLDGDTSVPGGSALSNLRLFLEKVGDHCGGLKVGQIVITGSVCGLLYFPKGTELAGEIDGIGKVAVSFV